jgi:uncharacterized spore protein YtfJ
MEFKPQDLISTIVEELKSMAKTEAIVGEPIKVNGKTIIPVIKISMGFGGGGGEDTSDKKGGTGGGGGGGIKVEPVAFIVADEAEVSLLPIKPKSLDKVVEVVPELISKIKSAKEGAKEEPSSDEQ